MKIEKKYYWKGLEQLTNDPEFVKNAEKEFHEYLPIGPNESPNNGNSRRDFLKMMGFSLAAVSLAACEAPIRKAIPYVTQPEDIIPGVPNYYASTYIHKGDYCSIVVKTREGRPIKIEGNTLSGVTRGGKTAQVEASILNLYDNNRLKEPTIDKKVVSWQELDQTITGRLRDISSRGGQIRIVSNTIISPTTRRAIQDFITAFPGTQHIMYDAHSVNGIRIANQQSFGQDVIPHYDFSRANVIVSFSADFLSTWISPIEYIKQYSQTRKLGQGKTNMSRHYQFEALLSLTGANADYRTPIRPSQEGLAVARLYNLLAQRAGAARLNVQEIDIPNLEKAADDLWAARGSALVVCGSNDPSVQQLVNGINNMLGTYQAGLINLNSPVYYRQGNDTDMQQFVTQLGNGNIDGVIFFESNPVYDHPLGATIAQALERTAISISVTERLDETSMLSNVVASAHNYLESWNDAEPRAGHLSLMQPVITPIFNTRQAEESIIKWAGVQINDYFTYIQDNWRQNYMPLQDEIGDFQQFWDNSLLHGVMETKQPQAAAPGGINLNLQTIGSGISNKYTADNTNWELIIYEKPSLGTGSMANNPWLQELPDPISRVCWDNYVTISQADARDLNVQVREGLTSMISIRIGDRELEVPALVQPGQANGTLGIALGYGRRFAGPVGDNVGIDVYPLIRFSEGSLQYNLTQGIGLEKSNRNYKLAHVQTHHTYMGRETIIQETVLPEYQEDPKAGRFEPYLHTSKGDKRAETISLWREHQFPNHHWGMLIDLNSCIGCGTCVVACNVENNVPVVGKDEVLNRREMHWLRIDRYYSSLEPDSYSGLAKVAENPEVIFQPMLCQQCNNAPCETVCPVKATTHSTEGLNQMTYNRCIGTRYCANNCPYKVRRFNWFKYHDNKQFMQVNQAMYNDLGKMVLNPDVTVRSRGVMEKCSFCVQRIQLGKLEAKKKNRRPLDGEITTACAQACPADAIVFGDLNDPESSVSRLLDIKHEKDSNLHFAGEPRAYTVLAELNTRSNIYYLTKVKNKDRA
jgi:MoCo/4Fe-4S cofactor protein with predicted Tat translocation signal